MNIENFQMLGSIIDLDLEGGNLSCDIIIPDKSSVFDFHFPGYPIVPGVLLIEMMAQASGHLIMAGSKFSKMAILAKVSHCKFSRPVLPGDNLICTVKKINNDPSVCATRCEISKDGLVYAVSELRMKALDFPSDITRSYLVDYHNNLISRGHKLLAASE